MESGNPIHIQTEEAFARQRQVDPVGHVLHAWLGALWCFAACGPMVLVELGPIPLIVCFLIRFHRHMRLHTFMGRRAAARCLMLWTAWLGASLSWTLDRRLGLEEFAVLRFALSVPLLWPVLDRRRLLIGGLAAGMLSANLAQVAHAAGVAWDVPWLRFPRMPDRNSGWWQPVVGGTMLTGALGLHLPAALTGCGKRRLIGAAGAAASGVGVIATGSRGAWLASAVLVCVAIVWALVGFSRRRRSGPEPGRGLAWGHLPLIAAGTVVIVAGAWFALGPSVVSRARAGIEEVQRALREKDYSTDTGARIQMARWAMEAIAEHPVRGVGAGGYHEWVVRRLRAQGIDPVGVRVHDHTHNTLLHVGATTGAVGIILMGGVIVFTLIGGFSRVGEPSSSGPGRGGAVLGYGAGPAMAMVGMVLVSPFDVIEVNAQTAALLFVLVALCMKGRARAEAVATSARDLSPSASPGARTTH
jgi:O-antigen ligase